MKNLKLGPGEHWPWHEVLPSQGPGWLYRLKQSKLAVFSLYLIGLEAFFCKLYYIQKFTHKDKLKSFLPHCLHLMAWPVGNQRTACGLPCWWSLMPVTNWAWWQTNHPRNHKMDGQPNEVTPVRILFLLKFSLIPTRL